MKKLLNIYEEFLDEDYPIEFDMEHFKSLTSFNKRIKYCEAKLDRISSGSSRIVYQIDDEKVLKLAKNTKGLAQNEVEIEYGQYHDLSYIVARTFDHHPKDLWLEMELAEKVSKGRFESITGFKWNDYCLAVSKHGYNVDNRINKYNPDVDPEVQERMWDDQDFCYEIFNFIGNYGLPVGDLLRLSTYGVVKRDHGESIVIIDYGLTQEVNTNYYSR
tara:strand:- start:31821 stop:32471 length:651 start_codon:yes stop_codon:yes gene_type:complete